MMASWDAKTVVITGVGRPGQVGEAVAHAFSSRGAHIVALDRTAEHVNARVADLRATGRSAEAHACDLTNEKELHAVAERVAQAHPAGIHALVCLAGGFGQSGPIAESSMDVWQRQAAINLTTAFLTTRAFLPMVRAARGGIVFFSSAAALPGGRVATLSAYAAAKAGVLSLMRAVAQEERGAGVRANALAPTAIRTTSNVNEMGDQVSYVERSTVAEWVVTLCAPDAGVSGQVIKLG